MARRKPPAVVAFLIPLFVGLAGFAKVADRPQFATYRTVDVVQLLGSGVCFGVAIVGLILMLRGQRP